MADVHIHLNETQPPPPPPSLASSSSSTFSLALDPIAETPTSPYPGTPLLRSPSLTDSLDQRPLKMAPQTHVPRRPPQLSIGLGYGPPPSPQSTSARSMTLVGAHSELILYSYAQLLGTVSITPLPGTVMTPEHAQTLSALRAKLSKRTVVGGGSMDITSHQRIQERRRSHGRSSSLTSSLFSLLSPATYSAPSTPLPSSQSFSGPARAPSVGQSDVGLGIHGEDIDPDAPLPTFDVQPAMLAVDLVLAPGESRTCELPVCCRVPVVTRFKTRTRFHCRTICRRRFGGGHSSFRTNSSWGRVVRVRGHRLLIA